MGTESLKILAAIAAGYLIGRTKKGRFVLALASGAMMAGRGLAQMGLDESKLKGVLSEVLADVQTSAGKALNDRAGRLSDTLRSQTEQLGGVAGLGQDQDAEDEEAEAEEGPEDSAPEDDRARDEANGGGEDRPTRQTSRRPDRGRATSGRRVAQAAARGGRS